MKEQVALAVGQVRRVLPNLSYFLFLAPGTKFVVKDFSAYHTENLNWTIFLTEDGTISGWYTVVLEVCTELLDA